MHIFWALLVMHCLTDFPLQGDFLALAKNRHNKVMRDLGIPWYTCLAAHAIISGGGVTLVTGSAWLGVTEAVFHAVIDYYKNEGAIGFNTDQALHVACKVAWTYLAPLVFLAENL